MQRPRWRFHHLGERLAIDSRVPLRAGDETRLADHARGGRGISVTNGVPKLRLEIDDFLFACDGRHRGTIFGGLRSVWQTQTCGNQTGASYGDRFLEDSGGGRLNLPFTHGAVGIQ